MTILKEETIESTGKYACKKADLSSHTAGYGYARMLCENVITQLPTSFTCALKNKVRSGVQLYSGNSCIQIHILFLWT